MPGEVAPGIGLEGGTLRNRAELHAPAEMRGDVEVGGAEPIARHELYAGKPLLPLAVLLRRAP
jgi:hypothetical protein